MTNSYTKKVADRIRKALEESGDPVLVLLAKQLDDHELVRMRELIKNSA